LVQVLAGLAKAFATLKIPADSGAADRIIINIVNEAARLTVALASFKISALLGFISTCTLLGWRCRYAHTLHAHS
jgi:hypothetical protein